MSECQPDKHYWAQEGPMTVACEDCDAQGVIRLVVHQVPEDNAMFSDNKNKAVLRELLDGPQ